LQQNLNSKSTVIPYKTKGNGPVLVLLHGAYINDRIWEKNIADLAKIFTVVTVQLPSHGVAQTLPVEEYRVQDFSKEVIKLLDFLGCQSAYMLGLSLGAMIGQDIAAQHPERVSGLVLVGSVASMRLTLLEKFVTQVIFPKRLALFLFGMLTTKQFLKLAFLLTWFMRGNKWLGNKATRQCIREMISEMHASEIKKVFAAVYTFREQDLSRGTYPILLINGAFDSPIIHMHARHVKRRYADRTTVLTMNGCGHACNYDDPATFAAHITNWHANHPTMSAK
jgi:pimeloyl-ACP methyl ester carboxylesterase